MSGCPHDSNTISPATERRSAIGQIGTATDSSFGSTLPWVGHRSRGRRESHIEPVLGTRGPATTIHFVIGLVKTMLEAHDRMYLENADYVRTIAINNLGVGTTEFSLSPERAEALYESGRKAAEEFLEQWSFDRYIDEYRRGRQPSRRLTLTTATDSGRRTAPN